MSNFNKYDFKKQLNLLYLFFHVNWNNDIVKWLWKVHLGLKFWRHKLQSFFYNIVFSVFIPEVCKWKCWTIICQAICYTEFDIFIQFARARRQIIFDP